MTLRQLCRFSALFYQMLNFFLYLAQVFDAIFRYLDMIYPNVLIDDTNLAIVKIAKDFAGDDENELKWFPRNLPPIDISQLL